MDTADNSPRMRALRMLLVLDATVLFLLGALFIFLGLRLATAK